MAKADTTGTFGTQPQNRTSEVGVQPRAKTGWDTVAKVKDKDWSSTSKKDPLKTHKVAGR